jgi:hypothetical protein
MHRAGAAERNEAEAPQVHPLFRGMGADGGGHVLVDDVMNAEGGLGRVQPELPAEGCQRGGRALHIQSHRAAEKKAGVEIAEQQVGIRHRRLRPAAAVADRARTRPGRMRPDRQQPELGEARDRAAARADLQQLDR